MHELPTGTVTFLFTDVEGSTKLLKEVGDDYASLLAGHREKLRAAVAEHGGREMDTQGDAFFVAFDRARDALRAAAAAQEALADDPVRVRMGVHTGEPVVTEEGYVGLDVHRASRIAASGHGGQVLVSSATREIVGDEVELRSLGEHRLKDFDTPVAIFQLGDRAFPPLRTLDEARLPVLAAPLVGRKKELADVLSLYREEPARMVTVTGPGGVGKTRFAMEVAAELLNRFPDGVRFVDLGALDSAESVVPAISEAVGARDDLVARLRDRELLLVLDNFEHVADATPSLAVMLDACRGVSLLVTSRERLHLGLEQEYPLRPLAEAPAVELFRQSARLVDPEFEGDYAELVEICDRLDRLPLAIELAAARVKLLDPAALRARLEQRLPVLASRARDLPERQRTLRATIEWSYGLLDPDEQQAFRRLAVFAGGATLDAVTEVTGADLDLLESLVDKSLLRRSGDRLSLLETIRELALEKLGESGEEAELRNRHASYYSGPADEAKQVSLRWGTDPEIWEWFRSEQDNLRAAIAWLLETGEHDAAVPLVSGCAGYWLRTGSWTESERLFEEVLSQAKSPRSRAATLFDLANVRWRRGAINEARVLAEEVLEIAQDESEPDLERRAKHILAVVAYKGGDLDAARVQWAETLADARASGDDLWAAMTLSNLGNLELDARDLPAARAYLEENVAIAKRLRYKYFVANNSIDLAMISLLEGAYEAASSNLRESLDAVEEMTFVELLVWNLTGAAAVALFRDDREAAGMLLGAVSRLSEDLGVDRGTYSVATEIEERSLEDLGTHVDEGEVVALLERGRALSQPDVVALARRVLG